MALVEVHMQTARFPHNRLLAYPIILEALVRGDAVAAVAVVVTMGQTLGSDDAARQRELHKNASTTEKVLMSVGMVTAPVAAAGVGAQAAKVGVVTQGAKEAAKTSASSEAKEVAAKAARAEAPVAKAGGAGSGLTNQTRKQLLESRSTLKNNVAEHEKKLADYIKDPRSPANDNKGLIRNAPTEAIKQKIIDGRIESLRQQITKNNGELAKVEARLKEVK